jgi:hypothetical protein
MGNLREPKLGVAVGRKGVGKSFTTFAMLDSYVKGNPKKGVKGRRVLIFDVNDEYDTIRSIAVKDLIRFSIHPQIEIRRVRPYNANGTKMGLRDISDTLGVILQNFSNGLLLIEDINKYVSDSLPNDLVGKICTNRHVDLDIIMHFQSIGRIVPKIWQNLNWIRFHKITDSTEKHREKLDDYFEVLNMAESIVNAEFQEGNERYYLFVDLDDIKIKGNIKPKVREDVLDYYLSRNYNRIVRPRLQEMDSKGMRKYSTETALKFEKDRLIKAYFLK